MRNLYLESLINKNKHYFTDTESTIASHFKKIGDNLSRYTLSKISKEIDCSETSIFKFVKKLGFSGFQDFKISVANHPNDRDKNSKLLSHLNIDLLDDVLPTDSIQQVGKKVISSNIASLTSMINTIDELPLEAVLKIIERSNEIFFIGIGGSSITAYDSYHKFLRTKYRCSYIQDAHMQLIQAIKLNKNDCVFLFSHSGKSTQTVQVAKAIKKSGAKIISLTGNPNSELAKLSDECLTVCSQSSAFRTETLTSRILYLSLMDIIYVNTAIRDQEKNTETLNKIRSVLSDVKSTQ